jgi:hypothetical protein
VRTDPGRPALILSRYWKKRQCELSFVIRSIAGAASRGGPVTVLIPGAAGTSQPDGAFDLIGIGAGLSDTWPSAAESRIPGSLPGSAVVIVDELTDAVASLLRQMGVSHQVFAVTGSMGQVAQVSPVNLAVVDPKVDSDARFVGMHVPVNPLAATHRHNGFGFIGYTLVLSDRSGHHAQPPDAAAWLTAGFYDANVVVVENATASVWRGRALRGVTSIDSQTDLWRLIAHARVCVDTAPGTIVARECVESLRFGTPVIVPGHASAAATHAAAGGGLTYDTMTDLLRCVGQCQDEDYRAQLSAAGKDYADATYGDPALFTERVLDALKQ